MFNKILLSVWHFIKKLFTEHIGLKIVALLAAVMLWAYVLNDENPYRIKNVTGVNLSFEGEAELLAKGLCVRGDRSEILEQVTVAVKTQIANYSSLGTGQINASVSLRNISEARTYDLPVSATVSSGYGSIQSITPTTIKVEIDTLVKKTIPIAPVFIGSLPEGFWADMDASSITARIDIEGPKTDISNVKRAECVIDLTNCTSLLYSTYDLIMYGAEDEVVDPTFIVGTIPSATVRVPIYHEKTVPVDLNTALTGTDKLTASNYEIRSVSSSPETVRIVGEAPAIDAVEALSIVPVDVSTQTGFKTYSTSLILPEGIRLPDNNIGVSLSVDVEECTAEVSFDTIALAVKGVAEGLTATTDIQTVTVEVEGPYSILNSLSRRSISVLIDLSNLSEGEYDIPFDVVFNNTDATSVLEYSVTDPDGIVINTVHVVIVPKA